MLKELGRALGRVGQEIAQVVSGEPKFITEFADINPISLRRIYAQSSEETARRQKYIKSILARSPHQQFDRQEDWGIVDQLMFHELTLAKIPGAKWATLRQKNEWVCQTQARFKAEAESIARRHLAKNGQGPTSKEVDRYLQVAAYTAKEIKQFFDRDQATDLFELRYLVGQEFHRLQLLRSGE